MHSFIHSFICFSTHSFIRSFIHPLFSGLGMMSGTARVGSILAPFIVMAGESWPGTGWFLLNHSTSGFIYLNMIDLYYFNMIIESSMKPMNICWSYFFQLLIMSCSGIQFTIFGVLGISGGILSLWLPETKVYPDSTKP